MRRFTFVLLLAVLGTVRALPNAKEKGMRLFEEFVTRFDRHYATDEERLNRYNIFENNVKKILELNNNTDGKAVYSHLTQWADLTVHEFTAMHGFLPQTICQFATSAPRLSPSASPKPSLDYVALGATVKVKNQGKCGSCWAHATTAVVEGRLKIDTGTITSLSEQYLMDCDPTRVCGGCCGGLPERALQWLANETCPGIAGEQQYPYVSGSGEDPTKNQCKNNVPLVGNVTGFGVLNGDAMSMLSGNTEYGLLGVAMDSSPLQFYKSGIITNPKCSETSNHAVAIVGYGSENGIDYWKVRNSYGTQFGEDGYFRIERTADQGAPCGMNGCVIAATGAKYISSSEPTV